MRYSSLAAVAIFGACATITAPPTPESARIHVQATQTEVIAAMTDEGLTVESANDGIVTTLTDDIGNGLYATYRATVVDGRATLTATVRNVGGERAAAVLAGAFVASEETAFPLHSEMKDDRLKAAWGRLERIADALRAAD